MSKAIGLKCHENHRKKYIMLCATLIAIFIFLFSFLFVSNVKERTEGTLCQPAIPGGPYMGS